MTPKIELRIEAKAQNAILWNLRKEFGGNEQLAAELGVCGNTVSKWINFTSIPTEKTIRKKPNLWKHVIPKLEELTGKSWQEIFPEIPPDAVNLLAERQIRHKTVTVEQIESSVEALKLTYEEDVSRSANLSELRDNLDKSLKSLTYRQREVIKLRYGLGEYDGHTYTYEEIGHIFKVSRERVRQIEMKAIRRLQGCNKAAILVGHVD